MNKIYRFKIDVDEEAYYNGCKVELKNCPCTYTYNDRDNAIWLDIDSDLISYIDIDSHMMQIVLKDHDSIVFSLARCDIKVVLI